MALRKIFTGLAAAAAALLTANAAKAITCDQVNNSGATNAATVYVAGSSAAKNVLQKIGPALFDAGVSVVYYTPSAANNGSCDGTQFIEQQSTIGALAGTGNGLYYNDGGPEKCDINPSGSNIPIDVGFSDVDQGTCDLANQWASDNGQTINGTVNGTVPAAVGSFDGPVQVMEVVQPASATISHAISAEQAFYVFQGQSYQGADFAECTAPNNCQGGGIAPWDQATENATAASGTPYLFIRNEFSGTQNMIGQAINLPSYKWVGDNAGGSVANDVEAAYAMTTATAPFSAPSESTLGILVAGTADPLRTATSTFTTPILPLAFRSYGQYTGAWYPDSTDATGSTAFDKINVREGRYSIFGALQVLFTADSNGKPTGNAQTLVNFLNGTTSLGLPDPKNANATYTIDAAFIDASTIPACAMSVSRGAGTLTYTPTGATNAVTYNSRNQYNNLTINTARTYSCDNFFNGRTGTANACTACTSANASTVCTGASVGGTVCGVDGCCEAF